MDGGDRFLVELCDDLVMVLREREEEEEEEAVCV